MIRCTRRATSGAAAVLAACLLAACSAPMPATDAEGTAPALRPLARQPAHPSGAAPRSQVAPVYYGLFGDGTRDDGVPGDAGSRDVFQRGSASGYGLDFHNRKTANGERFDMGALTAAHRTLPFGSRVCVRSLVNGKEVLVRINDRGPYAAGRIIDLSRAAATAIDMLGLGIKQVALTLVDRDGARCSGAAVADSADAPAAPERPAPKLRKEAPRRR